MSTNVFRHPDISYASKKKAKSDACVLSLSLEDPASNYGIIKISEKLVPFVPAYPSGKKQKTIVFGDQGYVERGERLILWNMVMCCFSGHFTYHAALLHCRLRQYKHQLVAKYD